MYTKNRALKDQEVHKEHQVCQEKRETEVFLDPADLTGQLDLKGCLVHRVCLD